MKVRQNYILPEFILIYKPIKYLTYIICEQFNILIFCGKIYKMINYLKLGVNKIKTTQNI